MNYVKASSNRSVQNRRACTDANVESLKSFPTKKLKLAR
jgi:hypothetical protein